MRPIRLTPLLGVVLLMATPPAMTPALAQVTVDLGALQALPERTEPAPPRRAPAPRPAPISRAPAGKAAETPADTASRGTAAAAGTAAGKPASTPQPPAAQPALPGSAPAEASIPPVAPPTETAPPPPPPTVSAAAPTKAEPGPAGQGTAEQGLRLLFGAGSADLSPDSAASLKQLASGAGKADSTTFNVLAYAAGSKDDPSTARRLSLARAMAVRSALIGGGVPSARIYVRALGNEAGKGPVDRVDVSVMGGNADSAPAGSMPPGSVPSGSVPPGNAPPGNAPPPAPARPAQ
ncbi:OmpA family protein [Rhodopila sp.]|jgi:outer membrane protein OmpA-like peptidoglycan-associated protein|uniref:OmpA family protein n=1 Tax=Rhodopila sp. TaxID=2480087 RepID=UPI002C3FAAAA|nr:OmpA family protein [Rhodopila sp.]HVZ10622.1 OmpA family protein [Rhodopila sp.]